MIRNRSYVSPNMKHHHADRTPCFAIFSDLSCAFMCCHSHHHFVQVIAFFLRLHALLTFRTFSGFV